MLYIEILCFIICSYNTLLLQIIIEITIEIMVLEFIIKTSATHINYLH